MKFIIGLFQILICLIVMSYSNQLEISSQKRKKIIKKKKVKIIPDIEPGSVGLVMETHKVDAKLYPEKNLTNKTLFADRFLKGANQTYTLLDSDRVVTYFQNWDYNLLSSELQDIFQWMIFKQNGRVDQDSLRIFYEMFVSQFKACDENRNNLLDFSEFLGCVKNNTEFRFVKPAFNNFTALTPNATTSEWFYDFLYFILNSSKDPGLNFHSYMKLNLYAYSWKKCSVFAPYITESSFECAMEIAAQLNVPNGNKLRQLYNFWVDTANNQNLRFLDFSYFIMLANSVRIYSKVNFKKDDDLTQKELELAMDQGMLPSRYNMDTIQHFYDLIEKDSKGNNGFDLFTFVYYDYYLRLFNSYGLERPYFLNLNEFALVIDSYLFSNRTRAEIELSPAYNMTWDTYNQYGFANMSKFFKDENFFFKFSQVETEESSKLFKSNESYKKSQVKIRMRSKSKVKNRYIEDIFGPHVKASFIHTFDHRYNISREYGKLIASFFNLLDTRQQGYINFYDFANFVQLGYVFNHIDNQLKGTVTNDELYDRINSGFHFPSVGKRVIKRIYRLNEYEENLPFDFYSFVTIMKVDDLIMHYFSEAKNTLISEVEMKKLLSKTNMRFVPDHILNRCLRGTNSVQIPLYDWECAFKYGLSGNLRFFRDMNNRQVSKLSKLRITNTAIYNINPMYE